MLKRFVSYYKPYKVMFTLDMLASLFIALIAMGYPILTHSLLSDIIPNEALGDKRLTFILVFTGVLLLCYIVRSMLKYFVQYYGHVVGVNMQADMRRDMFKKLQRLPFSYYDEHETGKIMSRMINDLQDVSELAHHGPENFFISGVTILLSVIYLFTINWVFTLVIICVVPFLILITYMLRKKMNLAFTNMRKAIATVNADVESSITGVRVTKAFCNSEIEYDKFDKGNKKFVKERAIAYKRMGEFLGSTTFVTDVFNVIILLAGGILYFNKQIDLADFTAFVISVNLFINPLTQVINFFEQFQNGVTGFKRFTEIMDEPEEMVDSDAIDIENVQGNIEFKNVSFEYNNTDFLDDDTLTNNKAVLNDVSFKIEAGKKIALVGPSGGGKTTICHLIPNFYKINEGSISIDGIDINHITLNSLRNNIGIVQQDVFLFGGSIKDNILYGKPSATDSEVVEAAKKANIHEYIMSLENGYETRIGERGVRLSGGQKQRIAIARVFLKNPAILILDEATSALDNATELMIQESLDKLSEGRTNIVVAHRLSTIKNADEILVVMDGMIVEHGSHDALIKQDGEYKKLYEAQFNR